MNRAARAQAWGWRLLFLSGVMPLAVGVLSYALFLASLLSPDELWRTPLGSFGFTLEDARVSMPGLAALFTLVNHMGWANLITSGVLISALSWFGVRQRLRWCWFAVLFVHAWTGTNDLIASLHFGDATGIYAPLPLIPMSLGAAGLIASAGSVFGRNRM